MELLPSQGLPSVAGTESWRCGKLRSAVDVFRKDRDVFCSMTYPLVMSNIAIEHGPVEIVDFPINSMVISHSYVKLPEGKELSLNVG